MIQSVERAVRILETLDAGAMGVHELARHLGLKTPTVHNFLKSLCELGFVERLPGGRYALGRRAALLGMRKSIQNRLIAAGRTVVPEIVAALQESVVLAEYSDGNWRELLEAVPDRALFVRPDGMESPDLYITATGRVILAYLDEAELEEYLARRGLPCDAWEGINERGELLRRLELIRRRGVEIVHKGEICGVAVPLPAPDRSFAAAFGVYLPTSRLSGDHQQAILRELTAGAERIVEYY